MLHSFPPSSGAAEQLSRCALSMPHKLGFINIKGASISVATAFGPFWRCGKFPTSLNMYQQTKKETTVALSSCERTAHTEERQLIFLRKTLEGLVNPYLEKNASAVAALNLISAHDETPITYDHFAFRTFGVGECGIDSIADFFVDFGYKKREQLLFPEKKLRAFWYSPPEQLLDVPGGGVDGPLPRIFISEIRVEELSIKSQEIIKKYASNAVAAIKYPVLAGVLNLLPWPTPQFAEYQQLGSESEYAAWTLVNGYALNHLTVSVHRLLKFRKIESLNQLLLNHGIRLNTEGSILKVSPDGGLQQSSTVADSTSFTFADGEVKTVPASYIEFAERLVLPKFKSLPENEVHEWHRRDGFEVGNADKIFASTFSGQTGVR